MKPVRGHPSQTWTKERRARQASAARRAHSKKRVAMGASPALAASITEDECYDALGAIALTRLVPTLLRMPPRRFAEIAEESGIDSKIVAAVHARLKVEFANDQ